jgi:hypothetical protein
MSKQSGEWKVTFFRRNGEPVDLWYTVNSYEDAKAFANRIQATDRELSAPRIGSWVMGTRVG